VVCHTPPVVKVKTAGSADVVFTVARPQPDVAE
jgi:hypothetical protein